MLPHVIRLAGIECIFSVEESPYASLCLFDFVRSVRNKLLRKSHETSLSAAIGLLYVNVLAVVGHAVLFSQWLKEPSCAVGNLHQSS